MSGNLTSDKPTALIVGAGIGGLAAGVALKKAGWRIRIHEQASNPRELGFGLLLARNAMAALRELDLAGPIEAAGAAPSRVEVRNLDGRVLRRFNAQLGGPSVVALRPVLHGTLLEAVGSDSLVLSSEVAAFTEEPDGVTVSFTNGGRETADLLVGADGVASVIRRQLHPDEPPPRASGYTAVRGVANGVVHALGDLGAVAYLGDGIEAAAARASTDAIYWYLSLLSADVPADTRSATQVRERLLPRFDKTMHAIMTATEPDNLRLDPLFRRDALPWWGRGRVTLLGDAAHPVMPHTGQGAALALEDAVALGIAMSRGDDVAAALRGYEHARSARTRKFIALGPRIARITTTHNPVIRALRSAVIRLIPAP